MEKVAGLFIQVDAKEATKAAEMLQRLVESAQKAEESLSRLKSLAVETAPTIRELGKIVGMTQSALDEMGGVMEIIKRATDQATKSTRSLNTAIKNTTESTIANLESTNRLASSMQVNGEATKAAAVQSEQLEKATKDIAVATQEAVAQRDRLTVGLKQSTDAARRNEAENTKLERRVNSLNKELARKENYLVRIAKRALAAAAGVFALNKAAQLVRAYIRVNQELGSMQSQLEFVTGSAKGAEDALRFLREESDRAGISFMENAKIFGSLQFSLHEVGVEAKVARELFQGVSAAAATFGMSAADTSGILFAFMQMANKGVVSSQELRNQIGSRLPGAFSIAARAMNMTTIELSRAMAQGDVMAYQLLPAMAKELNNVFGEGVERQADNLLGTMNRLRNAWQGLLGLMRETEAGNAFQQYLNAWGEVFIKLEDALDPANRQTEAFIRSARRVNTGKLAEELARVNASIKSIDESALGAFMHRERGQLERRKAALEAELKMVQEFMQRQNKARADAAEAAAKTERELFENNTRRLIETYDELYERLDAGRSRNFAREIAAGQRIIREHQRVRDELTPAIAEASERGDAEMRNQLVELLNKITDVDPWHQLRAVATSTFDDIMSRGLSEAERLEAQLKRDLERVDELSEAMFTAGLRFDADTLREKLKEMYREALAALETVPVVDIDLTSLRMSLERAISEAFTEGSKAAQALTDISSAVDGGGIANIVFGTGYLDKLEEEFGKIKAVYEARNAELAMMQRANDETELEFQQRFLQAKLENEQRYADAVKALNVGQYAEQAQAFGNLQNDLLTLAKSGSKEMARVYKAVAIADTIISTYKGAQQAFTALAGIPYIGPALGASAAGVAIAAGMARVQAIRATNYSGAYERGGMIPAGSVGLVGEAGPEMVRGPAVVTSARSTADRLSGNVAQPKVNVVVNNNSGAQASVRERRNGDEVTYEVLIERMERDLAGKLITGGTPLGRSMEQAYALRRGTR